MNSFLVDMNSFVVELDMNTFVVDMNSFVVDMNSFVVAMNSCLLWITQHYLVADLKLLLKPQFMWYLGNIVQYFLVITRKYQKKC